LLAVEKQDIQWQEVVMVDFLALQQKMAVMELTEKEEEEDRAGTSRL
jgi:hypothetical protein